MPREPDGEHRPLPRTVTSCGDRSLVQFDEALNEGEADSEASFAASLALLEELEDVLQVLVGQALAVVPNLHDDGRVVRPAVDLDGYLLGRVLRRVVEQVLEDLPQPALVTEDDEGAGQCEVDTGSATLVGQGLSRSADILTKVVSDQLQ